LKPDSSDARESAAPRLGGKAVLITTLFYVVCVSIATWPRMFLFRSSLPDRFDALQHLWIMRWYKTCLFEGRSVFLCPEIQHPIGAPLGNFSSLHLQALLYLPLSLVIANDVICYNLIWLSGLLLTGLGTFAFVWHVLRDRRCAAFGGLLAMLSTPVLIHAHGHLELIFVGGFPLFLVAWMRFVERPGLGRMVLAVLAYVVVAMSAAYFLVFAIFPALLYLGIQALRGGYRGAWPWLRGRTPWLIGFAGAALPLLLVLFSSQIWGVMHGFSLVRLRDDFNKFGAPPWSYVLPTGFHALGRLLPLNSNSLLGTIAGECSAYLGVVTLLLIVYAAIHRVAFPAAGYLWSALALLVVLSFGAFWHYGMYRIPLPSAFLWKFFPIIRMTRAPARFSLFAGVLASVVAAAGLRHLLARLPSRGVQWAVLGGLTVVAVVDLSMAPFWYGTLPQMPGCYAFVRQTDPHAALVEVPHIGTGGSELNAACTYWQALHRLTTSAGYSGQPNAPEDARMGHNSPFHFEHLVKPDYLRDPAWMSFDVTTGVDYKDFVWLYLTVNRFDYVVVHKWASGPSDPPLYLDRVFALLDECRVYDDAMTTVFARERLRAPLRPVTMCLEEWQGRSKWKGRWNCRIPQTARFVVYNPDADQDLTLVIDAATPVRDQAVRVRAGAREVAVWRLPAGDYRRCVSPTFRLPAGLQELAIDSGRAGQEPGAQKPHGLRVAGVGLYGAAEASQAIARGVEDRPAPEIVTR
jgi:hypothetical protein